VPQSLIRNEVKRDLSFGQNDPNLSLSMASGKVRFMQTKLRIQFTRIHKNEFPAKRSDAITSRQIRARLKLFVGGSEGNRYKYVHLRTERHKVEGDHRHSPSFPSPIERLKKHLNRVRPHPHGCTAGPSVRVLPDRVGSGSGGRSSRGRDGFGPAYLP
jgi:hypothetical protein